MFASVITSVCNVCRTNSHRDGLQTQIECVAREQAEDFVQTVFVHWL